MNQNLKATLSDVQFAILDFIYKNLGGNEWTGTYGELCNTIMCHDEKLIEDALALLVEEGKITIQKYSNYRFIDYKQMTPEEKNEVYEKAFKIACSNLVNLNNTDDAIFRKLKVSLGNGLINRIEHLERNKVILVVGDNCFANSVVGYIWYTHPPKLVSGETGSKACRVSIRQRDYSGWTEEQVVSDISRWGISLHEVFLGTHEHKYKWDYIQFLQNVKGEYSEVFKDTLRIVKEYTLGNERMLIASVDTLPEELKEQFAVIKLETKQDISQVKEESKKKIVPLQNLNKFLSKSDFCITPKAKARKAYEELSEKRFRNLGSPIANQVVRDTIAGLSPILTLDASRSEFAPMCIRILEELVRVGVRNYQDHSYLRDPAQKYIKEHLGNERKRCETDFYQPFLRTELQRDEFFAGKIVAGAALSGGITDILTIYQIPIETKVIYSDSKGEESTLDAKGVGQDAQYASLSRVAFLSVLDLSPRNTMADLSNIQNDVKVIPVLQKEGNHDVKIVRVQHICGYGAPSVVR